MAEAVQPRIEHYDLYSRPVKARLNIHGDFSMLPQLLKYSNKRGKKSES